MSPPCCEQVCKVQSFTGSQISPGLQETGSGVLLQIPVPVSQESRVQSTKSLHSELDVHPPETSLLNTYAEPESKPRSSSTKAPSNITLSDIDAL